MVVIGVGNPFRGDDGIGPYVVETLRKYSETEGLELFDGGTDAFTVMEKLREHPKAVIIDAARMNGQPGDVRLLHGKKALKAIAGESLTSHGFGLAEMFKLMELLDINTEVSVIGVEPEQIDYCPELSPTVKSQVDNIIALIKKETEDVLRHSGPAD